MNKELIANVITVIVSAVALLALCILLGAVCYAVYELMNFYGWWMILVVAVPLAALFVPWALDNQTLL